MYGAKAKEAGVYIVGACGFDSIPADLGILFTKQQFSGNITYIHRVQVTKNKNLVNACAFQNKDEISYSNILITIISAVVY